jgi:serine/threonine protein phosphatase 1
MTESMGKLAIVGDIHGNADRLSRALNALLRDRDTHIIFTGDYVNRGPETRRVLELLIAAYDGHPAGVTFVRGNHEAALLAFLDGGDIANFAAHGGLATIRSYLDVVRSGAIEEFRRTFPRDHRLLLETMSPCFENSDLLVSHAGFDPADPLARTAEILYETSHPALFSYKGPWPKQLTVCGHYVQREGIPYDSEHLVCLDTGCGTLPEGPLTVISLPARRFAQF